MIEFLNIKVPDKEVKLFIFGDLHFGGNNQDLKTIKKGVEYVLGTPNCYALSIGDNLDLGTLKSYGILGKTESVMKSVECLANTFRPLAESGKLLGLLQGNHDTRLIKSSGTDVDLTETLVNEWNAVYKSNIKYAKPAIIIRFEIIRGYVTKETESFIAFFIHGTGGGSAPGTVVNWMNRMKNLLSDADIYGQGHHHQPIEMRRYLNKFNSQVGYGRKEQLFFTVGGHIEDAEYAETKMLQGCPTYDAVITMSGRKSSHGKKKMSLDWFRPDV